MSLSTTLAYHHVTYRFLNAKVKTFPFSHFYVKNVFPDDFYRDILDSLPPSEEYSQGKSAYHGRKFADPVKSGLFDFMLSKEFVRTIYATFQPDFEKRFENEKPTFSMDLRLVRDSENYSIGPHTDARWKVVSLLFYLPVTDEFSSLGTSIYLPKDRSFHCPGGPHHPFDLFDKVYTAPYLPNSCFGFFKTDYSFHGVDPITIPCKRDVLLWNLYSRDQP